jgi:hypothetical protein
VAVSDGLASKPAATIFSSLASILVVTVSPGLASKSVVGFLVEPQNQGGGGFPGLGLKTGSYDLVIWASKSLRPFFGLGLKTNQASVCRLRHKTDRGRSTWDTCQDAGSRAQVKFSFSCSAFIYAVADHQLRLGCLNYYLCCFWFASIPAGSQCFFSV